MLKPELVIKFLLLIEFAFSYSKGRCAFLVSGSFFVNLVSLKAILKRVSVLPKEHTLSPNAVLMHK